MVLKAVLYLGRQNITFRGHRDDSKHVELGIQNEMVDTCGIILRKSLVDEVKKCKFFSALADEVQDKSNHEQLAINIRYVNQEKQISKVFLLCIVKKVLQARQLPILFKSSC